jgi:hypothetical protein
MLSKMLQDYSEANTEGKQDMFEEAAERMVTAEKALKAKDETIAALRARLAEAEAALEPFAEESNDWSGTSDNVCPIIMEDRKAGGEPARFSIGDLRRAAAFLARKD